MVDYGQRAYDLFCEGYNCAQSVFGAFCDVTGLPQDTAMRLASGLGGGAGRLRELCGAVSGAVLALGLLTGYEDAQDAQGKAHLYAQVQRLAGLFREKNGSIVCRELLAGITADTSPIPSPRDEQYAHQRPCYGFVRDAANQLSDLLRQAGVID